MCGRILAGVWDFIRATEGDHKQREMWISLPVLGNHGGIDRRRDALQDCRPAAAHSFEGFLAKR